MTYYGINKWKKGDFTHLIVLEQLSRHLIRLIYQCHYTILKDYRIPFPTLPGRERVDHHLLAAALRVEGVDGDDVAGAGAQPGHREGGPARVGRVGDDEVRLRVLDLHDKPLQIKLFLVRTQE